MDVLYSFPSRLGAPGVGTTAWHHVAGLASEGVRVTVFCPENVRPLPASVRLVETLRAGPTRVHFGAFVRMIGVRRANSWHDRRTASYLSRNSGLFDVVHCWPLGAERTLSIAAGRGVGGFLERPNAHTEAAYEEVEKIYSELGVPVDPSDSHARNAANLSREEREYRLADRILCPSEFVMTSFLRRGFPAEKLVLTGRGYDPQRFNTTGRISSTGPIRVCFLGSGGPRKGLHYALRAWMESGAIEVGGKFLIAGSLLPSYRRILAPLLKHPSVEEVGFLEKPEDIMRSCDVLVLPSVEEASAKVTYEARACGCVLLVSDRSSCPVRDGVDALVHSAGDVEKLTQHLRLLATDSHLLESLRSRSLDAARTQTWSDAAKVLLGAYRDLLNDSA